jgi:hypothetical protein
LEQAKFGGLQDQIDRLQKLWESLDGPNSHTKRIGSNKVSDMRQSDEPHPRLRHLLDVWFSPKRFESEALYERLRLLFIKRYVPTGGDFFIRRYGIRIANIRGTLQSLIHFERYTCRLEAIHEIVFLGFLIFSLRRAILHRTTLLDLLFAVVVYVVLLPCCNGITDYGFAPSSTG